jgi:2-oxoacid:acceptor oxidoreductase gamma subunit (pyruvate/2-ketoisovalerate family)
MQEIRFHGRGGQGSVIGSEVLAHAFFIEDKYVQAFPAFGVERRGAPVTAFCRIDDKPIHLRNQIYEPDHIIVLDAPLVETVNVADGLKANGSIVINSARPPGEYQDLFGTQFRLYTVDAAAIAAAHRLGSASNPIVNTAILGAFSKATGLVGIDAIEQAIEEYLPVKKENNRRAAREAYNRVKGV